MCLPSVGARAAAASVPGRADHEEILVWSLAVPACGRVGFDVPRAGDDQGADGPDSGGDGPPILSCGALASTCGPTGSSPCCDSSVVMGGAFFRQLQRRSGHPVQGHELRGDREHVPARHVRGDRRRLPRVRERGHGDRRRPRLADGTGDACRTASRTGGWNRASTATLAETRRRPSRAFSATRALRDAVDQVAGVKTPPDQLRLLVRGDRVLHLGRRAPAHRDGVELRGGGGDQQRAYPWSSPPSSRPSTTPRTPITTTA